MGRTPDQILADFDNGLRGHIDVDMHDLLWEVMEDIRSSYRLAMENALDGLGVDTPNIIDEVQDTVRDYMVNHYGD